jgi:nucleotide-binding universal stress UspA family protein
VIIVPYIQKEPLNLDRIVCCWDGSRAAARAIADADPFLAKAKTVDLMVASTEKIAANDVAGADMAQHLARRGFKINLKQIKAQDSDVGSAILSYVADASADFLVMGGYGHSRLREFFLGGATRQILSSMTVPTLMSH